MNRCEPSTDETTTSAPTPEASTAHPARSRASASATDVSRVGGVVAPLGTDRVDDDPAHDADRPLDRSPGHDDSHHTGASALPRADRGVPRRRRGFVAAGVAGVAVLGLVTAGMSGLMSGDDDASSTATESADGAMPPIADLKPMRDSFGSPAALPARPAKATPSTDAGVSAPVALENGCLVAQTKGGDRVIVWPAGSTAVLVDGMVTVHDGDGRRLAQVGDTVTVATEATTPASPGASQCRPPKGTDYVDVLT